MDTFESINFELVKGIKKVSNQFIKLESELCRKYNLTSSQYSVIECLYYKGNMCINELIKTLISTSGTMTVIVKNLEKLQFVKKENKCDDKRFFKVCLTNKGKKVVEEMLPERNELINDFSSTLTNDEKEIFINMIYKFKNKYKED